MPGYRLFIDFKDPEPGDTAAPESLQALGRHAEEVKAWLGETHPFRFLGVGIDRLPDEDDSPEAEPRLDVTIVRKSGDLSAISRVHGALSATHSAVLLTVSQPGNVVTRFPLVNVLEWTESPARQ